MKRVEIVVLNWNGWRDTLACIASLQKLHYKNFGLIVVDNGSTDGSSEQIRFYQPNVKLVQTGANLGFGGGCNVGIRMAMEFGADYIWLINSDATADTQALSELVKVADSSSQVGAVGSVLYETGSADAIQLWGGGKVQLWSGRSYHQRGPSQLDFVSGASMLLRREAVEAVGGFDDRCYFMYWEDTDLGFRLRRAGWHLAVAEESRIWHKQSASLGKRSPLLDEYFTRSGVRFLRKYAVFPRLSVMVMVGMMLMKRLLRGESPRAHAVLKGMLEA